MLSFFRNLWLSCCAVIILLFACRSGTKEEYQIVKSSTGKNGMVVTAHPLASEVGLQILKQGGNAADAAIAVQLALAVVYPRAGNLGGGGFLVYRDQQGNVTSLDFREKAPMAAHKDMYLDSAGNVIAGLSTEGILAAGVPGTVAGLLETYEKYGTIEPFARLVEPAINLAENGFRLTLTEADRLNKYKEVFKKYNAPGMPFLSAAPWKAGDLFVQKDLAATLRRISEHGKDGFYTGPNADTLIALSESAQGILEGSDLTAYKAIWKTPVTNHWRGYEIHSMGLPSSGGIVLGQILSMIENKIVDSLGNHDVRNVHLIAEAERRAFMDRAVYLGDNDFYPVDVEQLLEKDYLLQKFSDFDTGTASGNLSIPSEKFTLSKDHFETTHISITDKHGNAASVTTTLNDNYGCKVWVPGGGYFLNNEMDDFSVKPGVPNLYGLTGSEANAIAPGKRMLSSMTPTIIEKDDRLWMVVGTPGGSTIITSVLQVFLNVAAFDMDIDQAVQTKRFHHQWLPDEIMVEEGAFTLDMETHLRKLGHNLKPISQIGLIEAILVDTNGIMHGAADSRSDDHAAGW
jgi:gamma-glutamyltranspeptidase/glutathione hydrolase